MAVCTLFSPKAFLARANDCKWRSCASCKYLSSSSLSWLSIAISSKIKAERQNLRLNHLYSMWFLNRGLIGWLVYGVYRHFQQYFSYMVAVSLNGWGRKLRPVASHWQTLSHNVVSRTPRHERGLNSQH